MQNDRAQSSPSFLQLVLQALLVLLLGSFLFLAFWLAFISIDQIWHTGVILPGISVAGIDVAGLTAEQAEKKLSENFVFSPSNSYSLTYADLTWQVNPDELGIHFDAQATAKQAFIFGRSGPLGRFLAYQLVGRRASHTLPAVVVFDQQEAASYLANVSSAYDQPLKEANLVIQGTQISTVPGQVGLQLDIEASLDHISQMLNQSGNTAFNLVVDQVDPEIMDASPYLEAAQQILSRPFSLEFPQDQASNGDTSISISPEKLAPMLTFKKIQENDDVRLVPQFQELLLAEYLSNLSGIVQVEAQNARFIFNDDTRELGLLRSATIGRELNPEKTRENLQSALEKNQNSALLAFNQVEPQVKDNATASQLGISQLVHQESSYFFGSSNPRIQNIETASEKFHGLLVAPGETFSMAHALGNISLDEGYAEALIIFAGRTIEGVGGGVCQVSTTLFRAAFYAGFPIQERHPHAYRVSYYEKTAANKRDPNLAGLDATVFVPLVDLVFTNDTPDWLLMETYINRTANSITWKFYSTSDGRSVDWSTTGPYNIKPPKEPLYKVNPDLQQGEIKQVDWEADGADVQVERVVRRNGEIILEDSFFTRYNPWRAIYEYGPGTEGIPESDEED